MILKSKAIIVWIDDHFITEEFQKDSSRNSWKRLFGSLSAKLYRHLDIRTKFIPTAKQALEYIDETSVLNSSTYYFFIVDRKLPYDKGGTPVDTASEDIVSKLKELKLKSIYSDFDFAMLSSSSAETYSIKGIDFFQKPSNQEFQLPTELKHKILINIKNNIGLIDMDDVKNNVDFFTNKKNKSLNKNSFVSLYPFIGQYKSFIEIQEIESHNFNTLVLLANNSISDNFILQNIHIVLFDIKNNYDRINYYMYDSYSALNESNHLLNMVDTNNIPIIRLEKWDVASFKDIYKHLKYQLKVFVIDQDDDNVNTYLEGVEDKTKVIKIDGFDQNTNDLASEITHTYINCIIDQKMTSKDISSDNVYTKYPQLLLHPLAYIMFTGHQIITEDLDDPAEIIREVGQYIETLKLSEQDDSEDGNSNRKKVLDELPLEFNNTIYQKAQKLYGSKYLDILINATIYWLSNSWNINYNIEMDDKTKDSKILKNAWQEKSFRLLEELISHIPITEITDLKVKKDFTQIKESIKNFRTGENLTIKINWPHEKYPMPIYMLKQLLDEKGKKLYVQDKDLNFIDHSIELSNNFKQLEQKISYYRHVYQLIHETKTYFPDKDALFLAEIKKRTSTTTNAFTIEDSHKYKRLINVLLRITLNFGMLVTKDLDKNKLTYKRNALSPKDEDKAGLGKLVQDVRDRIYKEGYDIFEYLDINKTCHSYLNDDKHIDYMNNYSKVLDKKNIKLDLDLSDMYDMSNGLKDKAAVKGKKLSIESKYFNKIFRTNNISRIAQLSNLSSYLSLREHELKIRKYKSGYKLLAYLADTRNTWEHDNPNQWHGELFEEYFIYSYEAIWLMHRFILENVYDVKNLPNTKYIQINNKYTLIEDEKKSFLKDFPTQESYIAYLGDLYCEAEE